MAVPTPLRATANARLRELNESYLEVHRRKEEALWAFRTGARVDPEELVEAEGRWEDFAAGEGRLAEVSSLAMELEEAGAAEGSDVLEALRGWRAFFRAHRIEGEGGKTLLEGLARSEAEFAKRRREHALTRADGRGRAESLSLGALTADLRTNPDETTRKSSFESLRDFERWMLREGFVDILRKRNAFARSQGARDFFEYRVERTESVSCD